MLHNTQKRFGKNQAIVGVLIFLGLLFFLGGSRGWAWITSNGVPICTATNNQTVPQLVTDTAGGAIVTWQDSRNGNDIYAQRVNSVGTTLWTTNGVAISTATNNQTTPAIAVDSAGGAIIVWQDQRTRSGGFFGNSSYDIYAQRVDSNGSTLWTTNGIAICTATNNQEVPKVIADGSGGAIIVWEDERSGSFDIYAQRVNSSGSILWTFNGVAICTATNNQENPQLISDGAGGAIITWQDERSGSWDIYAQRINSSGVVQWTTNGVSICSATNNQEFPQLTSDSSGGTIITWQDERSGSWDIYAQDVNSNGSTLWALNGVAICTATNNQETPQLISDGSNGAIITWQDERTGNWDIYAQDVNSNGSTLWALNGVAICTATNSQTIPQLTADGSGGAVITWEDARTGGDDIYAQRVNSTGSTLWSLNGTVVCNAANNQINPQIISSAVLGGSIIVWQDNRNGGTGGFGGGGTNYDIYAQSLDGNGFAYAVPPLAGFFAVPVEGVGPFSVNFVDTSANTPTNWTWNFGDGNSTTGVQYPTYTYGAVGMATTYTVQLIASNIYGASTATYTNYITVLPPISPVAGFFGTPTSGVGPLSVNFVDTSANFPTGWAWDFGDGNSTTGVEYPTYTYASVSQATTYTVTLVVDNSYGTSTAVLANYITVFPPAPPNAGFFATPTTGVGPLEVNFVDTSSNSPSSWAWSFGDGGTDTTEFPVYVYSAVTVPTYYSVQLVVTNNYGMSTATYTNYITVLPPEPPSAGFFGSPTVGVGPFSVNFVDTSSNNPSSWAWSFGDGGTDTTEFPVYLYSAVAVPTYYTVQLVVTNNYGVSTATYTNYIEVLPPTPPIAGFFGSPTVGVGPFNVNFVDTSANFPTGWAWDFGDGNSTTGVQYLTYTYGSVSQTTTYTVTLVVNNSYGTSTAVLANYITVLPPAIPIAGFFATPTAGMGPLEVHFVDTSSNSPSSWAWSFGDGGTDTTEFPVYVYSAVTVPTYYSVQLVATNNYGAGSVTLNNYIYVAEPAPTAGFNASVTVGVGPLSVTFTDTSGNLPTSWQWNFGDGGTSNEQSPTHIYAGVSVPTFYTVQLIASNGFGSSTVVMTNYIEILPRLVAGFYGSPTIGVAPLTVSFADTSGNFPTSWQWSFGDGDIATTQFVSYTYQTAGTFTVQLIATNIYDSGTAVINNYITVLPPAVPIPGFYGTPTTGAGPLTVYFFDTSGNYPTYWLWDYGDGSNPDTTQFTTHIFAANTVASAYTVTLVVANSNGTTQVTQPNYIYVISTTNPPLFITALPDLKMYLNQAALSPAFNIPDYVSEGGNPDTYSIVSNFLDLTSISGTSVSQGSYTVATVGLNSYQIAGTLGTTTASYLAKYSTYKIYKLPKIGLNIGESYTVNVANYTYDSTGLPTLAIPASYGNPNALFITDTTKVSAVWDGNTAVTITALSVISGADLVEVIASPSASPPYMDHDKESIAVYTNMFPHGTFATAADTTAYGLEPSPNATRPNMTPQTWLANTTDAAGVQASGIWAFNFPDATYGIKFTPFAANYLLMSSTQWYTVRARVAASGPNTDELGLYGFSNLLIANGNCDIAANVLFSIPTVWTWVETPMYVHLNTYQGYPQIVINAGGGVSGSVYIDEIQITNAPPTLVDANRGNTQLHYPFGTFSEASDTTGWGQELYAGASGPPTDISVVDSTLRLDFTGAGSDNELGIKWTANNGVAGSIYTPAVTVGREVGVRMNVIRESGLFNSLGIILVAAYGVQSSGQFSIGAPGSNLIAAAQVGQLIDGNMRTVGLAYSPFYQFQFGLRIDQTGVLQVSDVDFDSDSDDPNFGDSSLF